jgi:hypothetical protein
MAVLLAAAHSPCNCSASLRVTHPGTTTDSAPFSCRIFRAIEWTLFRMLVIPEGYSQYILLFYVVAGVVRQQQQLWQLSCKQQCCRYPASN